MKTKCIGIPIIPKARICQLAMRTLLFFSCFITFGFIPKNGFSQNTKITIDSNKEITVEEVLDLVRKQTKHSFIYRSDLFDNDPKVSVKKGEITVNDLFKKYLPSDKFGFTFLDNGDIIIKERDVGTTIDSMSSVQQTITGTVLDTNDIPLSGANILEKGTVNGVTADFDGNFTITANTDAILVISYIGFATKEITIGDQTNITVRLEESSSSLDEVVVIGFGERKKRDLTGSIATVSAETIEKTQALSPQFALQGNTTGVRVVNSSGDPNEAPQIFVRGIGTWNGDSQPLYVVDGQIFEPPRSFNQDEIGGAGLATAPNLFNLINPNDIESITVLKDASSAAIYGNRGANGVVLITTKKGKRGRAVIEFNTLSTFSNTPTWDLLNTQQYTDITREMFANNTNPDITIEDELYGREEASDVTRLTNRNPQFDPTSPFFIGDLTTYDWQDELVRQQALTNSYDIKVSGANNQIDYFISGSYLDQQQALEGNDLVRYTAAMNLNAKITKWLKVGVNYKYTNQASTLTNTGSIRSFARTAPWQPLLDASNSLGFAEVIAPLAYSSDWQPARLYGQGSSNNQLALNSIDFTNFSINRNVGNAYVELKPLKNLTLRGSINLDYTDQNRFNRNVWSQGNIYRTIGIDPSLEAPNAPASLGSITSRTNSIFNYQSDFTATYSNLFGKHSVNLTAAVQDQRHERQFENIIGNNLIILTDDPRRQGYGNDFENNSSILSWDRRFWFGTVGRLSYNYDSTYYVDLSARRDASNGFDDDFRWGNFYSASGAWRISNEKFMENLTFIDDLKLRGGWGQAGNDQAAVGNFAFLSAVSAISSTRFGSGDGDSIGNLQLGSILSDFPNRELSWEVVTTSYAGFDAAMFKNKLSLTFEWYNRTTDGVLQFVPLAPSAALNAPLFNIGKLENRGVDFQIGYNDNIGDFQYGISTNVSFLQNEVLELFDDQPLNLEQDGGYGRIEEGRSIGTIWGYKSGGIFQNQAEIDAYFSTVEDQTIANTDFVGPGDMYFLDVQGNPTDEERFYSTTPDGLVNAFDQTEIGNTVPGYTYGLNLNASWKGFDLSASFYGEGDVDKYNYARQALESITSAGPNYSASVLNRWTPQNTNTTIPRAIFNDPAGNNRFSDRFVESAAFFRLNNWQIGYSLNDEILEKLNNAISKIRIYVGGQNNIYSFSYSGLDPVNDDYPLAKSLTFGLNAAF